MASNNDDAFNKVPLLTLFLTENSVPSTSIKLSDFFFSITKTIGLIEVMGANILGIRITLLR